ncbi:serine/threonine-protein kinase BIK1-like [Apium graveolens]|uniref:serine/threonine-protein kinase BIK1-like n=1 Tax=Apium graveolens TaxID=4045 RepID=UPI003D7A6F9A
MDLVLQYHPEKFTQDQLKLATNEFSSENLIAITQFGKLYRGKIKHDDKSGEEKDVTLKIWEQQKCSLQDLRSKLKTEVLFLKHHNHPNLVKLVGCFESDELLATIYDISPLDTLHNLLNKDEINWQQTVNIALQFARLLEELHRSDYLVRNISAAHIMIDKDCNPILFDLSMLTGGFFGDVPNGSIWGSPGYIDPRLISAGKLLGARSPWSVKCDVYSYGALLLSIIGKKAFNPENKKETKADCWAKKEFKPDCSLVHKKLQDDPLYDARSGIDITALAMCCLEYYPQSRPVMMQIVKFLEKRQIKIGDA